MGKSKGAIPDRWLNYKPIGRQIDGTRFIAFKVPLKSYISDTVPDVNKRLDIEIILHAIPQLGLVIDLTNTDRYYNAEYFTQHGIEYHKLKVPGHVVPPQSLRNRFREIARSFLKKNRHNDKLIGVHCTHGVNRTGFFICDHMVTELAIEPRDAIKKFASARGHPIERQNYLNALHCAGSRESTSRDEGHIKVPKVPENWREKSSVVYPARRVSPPYRNGASAAPPPQTQRSYGRDSFRYDSSSHYSNRQTSGGNEERSHNIAGGNPFRREILWSTSAIPKSGQSLNDFRNERSNFQTHRNNIDQNRSIYNKTPYDKYHSTQKDNNSTGDRYRQVPRSARNNTVPNGRSINPRFEREPDQDVDRRSNNSWRNSTKHTGKFRSFESYNKTWRNQNYN